MGRPGTYQGGGESAPEMAAVRRGVLNATQAAGGKFLNACNENNVIDRIKDGTMGCTGGESAAAGTRPACSKRTHPCGPLLQRVLAVLQTFRDLDKRIAVVLELDVRRNVPFVFLQELQHVLDRRIALPPWRVAAAVGRLLLVLEVQVRDAGVVLLDERDRIVASLCVMADVHVGAVILRGGH